MKRHRVWNVLYEQLKKEPSLLQTRLTPESLAERFNAGHASRIMYRGEIIAYCAMWLVQNDNRWMEVGTLWVSPAHRGRNLAEKVLKKCLRKQRFFKVYLILITHVPLVAGLALTQGFEREHRPWMQVPLWQNICPPWDRYPSVDDSMPREGVLYFRTKMPYP